MALSANDALMLREPLANNESLPLAARDGALFVTSVSVTKHVVTQMGSPAAIVTGTYHGPVRQDLNGYVLIVGVRLQTSRQRK